MAVVFPLVRAGLLVSFISILTNGLSPLAINKSISEPCCLTEIVLDLVEEFAINATAKSIDIYGDFDPDVQIWIDGNSEQLYRVGANLI